MSATAPLSSVPEPQPAASEASVTPSAPEAWSLARRLAFRFAFAYLGIYYFPFPLDLIPVLGESIHGFQDGLWKAAVPWVGKHVLRLSTDITVMPNGSGDTTFNYVQVLMNFVIAVAVTGVWSVIDRRRTEYVKAHDVLHANVRYVLAMSMLSYGLAKLFKSQFPFPSPERLAQPLGDFSPMGLLWNFMGYSTGYNVFTGGAEFLGGCLLLFRRTTTLGALVVAGVMVNVVALNFFYDVPVKLYSSHLLLMSLFLVLPDARRLLNVLVLNRATQPRPLQPPFPPSRWLSGAGLVMKVLVVGGIAYGFGSSRLEFIRKYGDSAPRPPFYGYYTVDSFTLDGQRLDATPGDARRWKAVAVSRFGRMNIKRMDDTVKSFGLEEDAPKKTLTLIDGQDDSAKKFVLAYTRSDANQLVLQGTLQEAAIEVRLTRVDESKFLLLNRGFNWIQEAPFNR
ncbi:DoxX family membrane protein [Myxococcus sp. AB036A]|uniref:DoxX family membrane protein n=1 Tax=Myxococcus sp. AB036A TaxID=2562793 RepID=UPI0011471031|nr:DoxX family membrane protein [Myxococcus sp. AB036A]